MFRPLMWREQTPRLRANPREKFRSGNLTTRNKTVGDPGHAKSLHYCAEEIPTTAGQQCNRAFASQLASLLCENNEPIAKPTHVARAPLGRLWMLSLSRLTASSKTPSSSGAFA
eukprot:676758-Pyramimonas_sp.AAC.1